MLNDNKIKVQYNTMKTETKTGTWILPQKVILLKSILFKINVVLFLFMHNKIKWQ